MRALRVLRGMFGIALTWGVAWSVAGAILAFIMTSLGVPARTNLPLLQADVMIAAVVFGIIGFLNGVAFSIALAANERRKSFDQLVTSRIALWGVVGGVSYPALFALSNLVGGFRLPNDFLVAIPLCALFGALSAWSILAIARRAKGAGPGQLGAGAAPEFRTDSRERAEARST